MLRNPHRKETVRLDNKITNIYVLGAGKGADYGEDLARMDARIQELISEKSELIQQNTELGQELKKRNDDFEAKLQEQNESMELRYQEIIQDLSEKANSAVSVNSRLSTVESALKSKIDTITIKAKNKSNASYNCIVDKSLSIISCDSSQDIIKKALQSETCKISFDVDILVTSVNKKTGKSERYVKTWSIKDYNLKKLSQVFSDNTKVLESRNIIPLKDNYYSSLLVIIKDGFSDGNGIRAAINETTSAYENLFNKMGTVKILNLVITATSHTYSL